MMQLKLINLGRNNINATVTIKNPSYSAVLKEVKKYILSKGIDIEETETEGLYDVYVGGCRHVGQIQVDKPQFMILL